MAQPVFELTSSRTTFFSYSVFNYSSTLLKLYGVDTHLFKHNSKNVQRIVSDRMISSSVECYLIFKYQQNYWLRHVFQRTTSQHVMLEHRLVKCTNSKTTLLKCSVLHPSRMHVALQVRIAVSLSQKNIKQMIVQHAFSGCRTSSNIMFRSSLLYHHVDIMFSRDGHTCSTHTHVRGRIVCRSSVASTLTSNQFSIT